MRAFFTLFRKELRSFFLSPLAYVVTALFLFLNGWLFASIVQAMRLSVTSHSLVYNLFNSIFFWMGFFFLFPLITMRLFAEEKKLGTQETLFTAPVSTTQVLLAKYGATLLLYVLIIAPLFLFFFLFQRVTGQEAAFNDGALWGSALGLFLIGAVNVAVGCLASSLTANQLIAAMITFVAVMLHYLSSYLYLLGGDSGALANQLTYFSTVAHMQALSDGLIDTRPVVFYLSSAALYLFLTHHVLDYRKWRA